MTPAAYALLLGAFFTPSAHAAPLDSLVAVLEDRGLHQEAREQALFWLAQSESDRALAVFERLLVDGN